MSKMKNESITTIFMDYANDDEYQEAYKLNGGNLEECRDQFHSNVKAVMTKKEAGKIIDEAIDIEAAAEEVGFILGFKYAFKLAAETFSK